jgi:hypothetical protein
MKPEGIVLLPPLFAKQKGAPFSRSEKEHGNPAEAKKIWVNGL